LEQANFLGYATGFQQLVTDLMDAKYIEKKQ
jgi:hypothetical protein